MLPRLDFVFYVFVPNWSMLILMFELSCFIVKRSIFIFVSFHFCIATAHGHLGWPMVCTLWIRPWLSVMAVAMVPRQQGFTRMRTCWLGLSAQHMAFILGTKRRPAGPPQPSPRKTSKVVTDEEALLLDPARPDELLLLKSHFKVHVFKIIKTFRVVKLRMTPNSANTVSYTHLTLPTTKQV